MPGALNILDRFKEACQEKEFDKMIEIGWKVAKTAVLHKLGV